MLSFKIKFLIKFELSSAISLKNENIDYVFFLYTGGRLRTMTDHFTQRIHDTRPFFSWC